jgi:acyl-coenzyme A thioesterase PaaI-like protein
MPSLNELNEKIKSWPFSEKYRFRLISFAIGKIVPFFSTAGLKVIELEKKHVKLKIKNKKKVQNHMKSVHASAIGLLAEATSGILVAVNLPSNAKYSTLSTQAVYNSKAFGDLEAECSFSEQDIKEIESKVKGSIKIPVVVIDSKGNKPAEFVVEWSWKK